MAPFAFVGVIGALVAAARELRHRARAASLAGAGLGADAGQQWRAICRDQVVAGPFTGMHYPPRWGDASAPAKLLGSYEDELTPALQSLIARGPRHVVVVGSADGFYSVGLARALPGTHVDAFDPEWLARRNTARLAAENGVGDRVLLHGAATPERLALVLGKAPALVICDCEGYEDVLIDPSLVPTLATCDLLIELHEEHDPSMGNRLAARFPGAMVEFIVSRDRQLSAYGALSALAEPLRPLIVREFRGAQRWLVVRRAA